MTLARGWVHLLWRSKNTTYKWDTCGPHAILLAQGGGVISYKSLCELAHRDFSILNKFVDIQIVYGSEHRSWSQGGSAYTSFTIILFLKRYHRPG
jgi:inositol polyphosphate 1-phosphatase